MGGWATGRAVSGLLRCVVCAQCWLTLPALATPVSVERAACCRAAPSSTAWVPSGSGQATDAAEGRIVRSERRVSWVRLVEAGVDEVAVPRDDEVQGREQEFWRVYEASVGHVYGFLVRRCDRETAQDLTQEVFLQLARRVRDGDCVSGLGPAWLLSVARSRLVDHIRAEQRRVRKLWMAWSA